jgi:hypothetical protein
MINELCDEKRQQLDQVAAQGRSHLRLRHAEEQERFAASWRHSSALRYSKPSPQLEQLRDVH